MADEVRKTEDGKYILKVGDIEKQVTEAELFQLAQKAHGAESKFEEAARIRKESEGLAETYRRVLLAADAGDADAYAALLNAMGLPEEDKARRVAQYKQAWTSSASGAEKEAGDEEDDGGEEAPPAREGKRGAPQRAPLALEQLPEEVQRLVQAVGNRETVELLQRLEQETRAKDRNVVYEETWKEVAKDAGLGKIVQKGGPRAEKLRRLSDTLIRGRIRDGERYGPETRESVVKELRGLAEEFGSGPPAENPFLGVGPGPGIGHLEAQSDTPPERKPITDEGYGKSVLGRLAHRMLRSD